MSKVPVFEFLNYREALKSELIQQRRAQRDSKLPHQQTKKITSTNLALATGIQKSYMSKILSGNGQLNGDQLYQACLYFVYCLFKKSILQRIF